MKCGNNEMAGSNGENGINNENEIMKAKIIISGSIGSNNEAKAIIGEISAKEMKQRQWQ
jgi:hypothetical protein